MVDINAPPSRCYGYGEVNDFEAPKELCIVPVMEWLQEQFHFISFIDTDEIYFYNEGIYVPNGEKLINKVLEETFGKMTNKKNKLLLTEGVKSKIKTKIRDTSYVKRKDFDNNIEIINMKNGLYNWRTGEFTQHTSDYLSLVQIPVKYDPEADCPNIKKSFGAAIEAEDIIKMREFVAYCLYHGYPIQKAFILYGPGESGKSFIMMIIRMFLGDENCSNVSLQEISVDKFATSDMFGKLLNSCGDLDGNALKTTGTFKRARSGLENLRAQKKGLPSFDFINTAKLLFGTNKLLKSTDQSTGFFRSIEPIIMKKLDPSEIPNLPTVEDVTTEKEMSGLFNWVIETLPRLVGGKKKKFTNQKTLDEVMGIYKVASDPIMAFISNRMIESPGSKTPKSEVYSEFEKYCNSNNVFEVPSKEQFWIQLRRIILDVEIKSVNTKDGIIRCIMDYRIKNTWDIDEGSL